MWSAFKLAWLQLTREKTRLAVALAGVAFAAILVFMQIGFHDALFNSAVRFHRRLNGDVVIINPQSSYLAGMRSFTRRRLYQVAGVPGVKSVHSIYAAMTRWKHPYTGKTRIIFIAGFDPTAPVFDMADVNAHLDALRIPDVALFDDASRPEFGPVAAEFREGKTITTEVPERRVTIVGLFHLGTSFGIDGSLITSDLNFLRLFPHRPPGLIDIGLIRLHPGVDAEAVRDRLRAQLPNDIEVLTTNDYTRREQQYWGTSTPIGYVFTFGAIMGLVVGAVIVYQILFADISDHLAEYATLKAMGYTNRFLFGVVLGEAFILAVFGFVPGLAIVTQLYDLTEQATLLPMQVSPTIAVEVLGLTIVMCWVSGGIALRKLRSADPAEVF